METDSSVAYQGTSDSSRLNERLGSNARFSPEELRLLRECNRESFYYRCLPFAVSGMAATYLAVQNGYFKPHPRWGPSLKMAGAAVVGWFIGKMSYRSACEDKFVRLENSVIGESIRKRRGYRSETFQSESFSSSSIEDDSGQVDKPRTYGGDYHSSSGSLNFDVDKNLPSELDDRERPTTDSPEMTKEEKQDKSGTTYEELRRRNRAPSDHQVRPPVSRPSYPSDSRWSTQDRKDYSSENKYSSGTSEGSVKNVYGDTWDKPNF